jgi:glycosyltransferase involved in cell wall biosynthesis
VDDGSTDGSSTLCDQVALIDKRIEVIHQKNKGLSCARNTGTTCAHGNWIVYVDSDDVVSPNFLEHLYAAARLNHSDVAICRGHVFAESERFHEVERNRVTVLDRDAAITELLSERNASTAAWGEARKIEHLEESPISWGQKV